MNELVDFLVSKENKGVLPAYIYEEYINPTTGQVDTVYASNKLSIYISQQQLNAALVHACGTASFSKGCMGDEMSYEEFQELYEFGKFVNVRGWIPYIKGLVNKTISKETLYEYILRG